jgi:hypothetical protein
MNDLTDATFFNELAQGLAVVDTWPTPAPREEYIIVLTDAQYRQAWSFLWRLGAGLPERVTDLNELTQLCS